MTYGADGGIIKASGALNQYSKDADKHAESYYKAVRKMKTDSIRISQNTGYSEGLVSDIKKFLFLDKHDLGNGKLEQFQPDYKIAQSWQRLIDGKNIQPHDLTLLKHEKMEKELMEQGYSQDEAHAMASKIYNYSKEAREYHDKIDGNSK